MDGRELLKTSEDVAFQKRDREREGRKMGGKKGRKKEGKGRGRKRPLTLTF